MEHVKEWHFEEKLNCKTTSLLSKFRLLTGKRGNIKSKNFSVIDGKMDQYLMIVYRTISMEEWTINILDSRQ